MAVDPETGLEMGDDQNINKAQERITKLSSKVKETAQERDAEKAAREAAEAKAAAAEKERDFYADFSGVATKFGAASEHIEDIKAKVMSGYSVEDATVAVLNSAGKLMPTPPPPPPPPPPAAGGSATFTLPDGGVKPVGEMSRDEKRAALMGLEKSGDISV